MRAIAHPSVYATGLEWTTSSPPPSENFEEFPPSPQNPMFTGNLTD
ncbi:MAG: hypothetical protein KME50_36605 [Nostoc desertorum CM1-VF14]|nr:hypothetical protein [Nostoc desertorum CM1-VF14]